MGLKVALLSLVGSGAIFFCAGLSGRRDFVLLPFGPQTYWGIQSFFVTTVSVPAGNTMGADDFVWNAKPL